MLGGVNHHMLPHLPRVPHLHVNRPLVACTVGTKRGERVIESRGENLRNFWVGMCRWDPGTLSLYQS